VEALQIKMQKAISNLQNKRNEVETKIKDGNLSDERKQTLLQELQNAEKNFEQERAIVDRRNTLDAAKVLEIKLENNIRGAMAPSDSSVADDSDTTTEWP
jgi:hypothetical protein